MLYAFINYINVKKYNIYISHVQLCDPMNCSPPGSSLHEILQTRILEWVAILFSRRFSWSRDWTWVSCTAARFLIVWATREAHIYVCVCVCVYVCVFINICIYDQQPEQAMATQSSTLAWKIPWMEEPGRLQSMESRRVGHDWTTSLSRIGEGNGNPLQCSCLENPRDRGAWWAAVYGVARSRTRLSALAAGAAWTL